MATEPIWSSSRAAEGVGAEGERAAAGHRRHGVGAEVEQHLLERVRVALDRLDVAQFPGDADWPDVPAAEHVQRGLDGRVGVGALQGDAVRPGERLHPRGRPLDPIQGLGHHLHVFGQVRVVLHPLAHAAEAVLHAVERIGDLVGDSRHELADAEHLFLLADLGVGPVHIAADRGGEVDGDPQGAGEGDENAQQVQPVQGRRRLRIGGKVQGKAGNPPQMLQQHDRADQTSCKGRRKNTAASGGDTCPQ